MLQRFNSIKKQDGYDWLNELSSTPLQQSLRDLDKAYNSFFQRKAEFPRFKSKNNSKQSFRLSSGWKMADNRLQLPKGSHIKFRGTLIPQSAILKSMTISRDTDGKWYASIVSHESIDPVVKTGAPVGIDLGLTHLATTSVGKKHENYQPRKVQRKRMKLLQQSLSRKKGGSNSRDKAKLLVARLYKKIANQRMNHLHQTSHRITRENQALIVCEDLAVTNMMKNHKLADSIGDTGWAEFMRQLEYKQVWRGGEFIKVDRFFPSSKTCSSCGYIVDALPLSIRAWECPQCYTRHDRDINAAQMILKQGLRNSHYAESKDGILSNQVELPAR